MSESLLWSKPLSSWCVSQMHYYEKLMSAGHSWQSTCRRTVGITGRDRRLQQNTSPIIQESFSMAYSKSQWTSLQGIEISNNKSIQTGSIEDFILLPSWLLFFFQNVWWVLLVSFSGARNNNDIERVSSFLYFTWCWVSSSTCVSGIINRWFREK